LTVPDFGGYGSSPAVERTSKAMSSQLQVPTWRDSPSVCALADEQRHLGHIVRAGKFWLAFDGTHCDVAGGGFRLLGSWTNTALAKRAVEMAIANEAGRLQ